MPQFDYINYSNQIFWTFSLFLFFYFIILKNYLPFFSSVLKIRKKLFFSKKKLNFNLIKNRIITSYNYNFLILTILN